MIKRQTSVILMMRSFAQSCTAGFVLTALACLQCMGEPLQDVRTCMLHQVPETMPLMGVAASPCLIDESFVTQHPTLQAL